MFAVTTYVAYLILSISLTIWVARTLSRSGQVFLVDAFLGNRELAGAVNHLLVVGFYLVNIGFVCLMLKQRERPDEVATSIEMLSSKMGLVLLILGVMHFFNLYLFSKFRKRAMLRTSKPPVLPDEVIEPVGSVYAH